MKQVRYLASITLVDRPELRGDKNSTPVLSDIDARGLVEIGLAEYVDQPQLEAEHEAELEEKQAALTRPYANAVKGDWVEWAIAHGCDPDEADDMTKNQLMAKYGERL
jgi:hypothetical protein